MKWQTFGHESVKKLLGIQLNNLKFSHAYLLIGPSGIGKTTLAQEFAYKVTGAGEGSSNPDVVFLDHLADGGATEIREALATISTTPLNSPYKVVVIPRLNFFSTAGANSLLKILEEPSPHTIFVLTADSNSVLATIKSRCQVFNLFPLSDEDIKEYAKSRDLKVDGQVMEFSRGSVALVNKFVSDPQLLQKTIDDVSALDRAAKGTYYEKMVAVQTFGEMEVEDLEKLFLQWLWKLQRSLSHNPASFQTVNALLEALQKLSQSMNKKLIIQSVLLKV